MDGNKTREEVLADRQRTLDRLKAQDRVLAQMDEQEAGDLDAFKKLTGAQRTQIYRENPEKYRELYRQWTDELARELIEKGGR